MINHELKRGYLLLRPIQMAPGSLKAKPSWAGLFNQSMLQAQSFIASSAGSDSSIYRLPAAVTDPAFGYAMPDDLWCSSVSGL